MPYSFSPPKKEGKIETTRQTEKAPKEIVNRSKKKGVALELEVIVVLIDSRPVLLFRFQFPSPLRSTIQQKEIDLGGKKKVLRRIFPFRESRQTISYTYSLLVLQVGEESECNSCGGLTSFRPERPELIKRNGWRTERVRPRPLTSTRDWKSFGVELLSDERSSDNQVATYIYVSNYLNMKTERDGLPW